MLTVLSRHDTKRIFTKISENLIEFNSYETLWSTSTGADFNKPD